MRPVTLLAALAAAVSAPGCASNPDCGTGCLEAAEVQVQALTTTFAMDLPVTLQVCVGTACNSFTITGHSLAMPSCAALGGTNAVCSIDGQGTVVVSALPLPPGAEGGKPLSITATVTAGTEVLFTRAQMTDVNVTLPAGPGCGSCDYAQASFTVTAH